MADRARQRSLRQWSWTVALAAGLALACLAPGAGPARAEAAAPARADEAGPASADAVVPARADQAGPASADEVAPARPATGSPARSVVVTPAPAPLLRVEAGMDTATIWRIATDRQGRWAATASDDRTARVWELPSGRLLGVLRPPIGEGNLGRLFAVAMSPDGGVVATSGWTGDSVQGHPVYLFDRATGRMLRRLEGASAAVKQLVFSPDGDRLAAGLGGGQGVMVWALGAAADAQASAAGPAASDRFPGEALGLAWTPRGQLAVASLEGTLRVYEVAQSGLRLLRSARAPGGQHPLGLACNPVGGQLAVAYEDSSRVDVLDGDSLQRQFAAAAPDSPGQPFLNVAWSADGQDLYAAGAVTHGRAFVVRRWPAGGHGKPVDVETTSDSITALVALPQGGVLVAGAAPEWGWVDAHDHWQLLGARPTADFRVTPGTPALQVSDDGRSVAFVAEPGAPPRLRFDLAERSAGATTNRTLQAPRTLGLAVNELAGVPVPRLGGRPLGLPAGETVLSVTSAPAGSGFVLGTLWSLRAFDGQGRPAWTHAAPAPVWAVNVPAGAPGLLVAAYGDGTIRWHRLADGEELLALFVHADGTRWVAWTPSGYYDAGPGAEDLVGWHVGRGSHAAADFIGASRLRERYRRPDVVDLVLRTLDEGRALARAGITPAPAAPALAAAPDASWERPNLYVLAVGVSDYDSPAIPALGLPAKDASDFASVIGHQKGLLYQNVVTHVLTNARATRDEIMDGLDWLQKQVTQHDVGMLFLAGHGLDDPLLGYTFLPVNADLERLKRTAVSMADIRSTLSNLVGKAVFFLDTCHAGNALGGKRRAVDDGLLGAINELASAENGVVVFSSSTGRQDSLEDPAWGNGAFTKALIEGLQGRADYEHNGRITHKMLDLYVSERVKDLTHGKQSPVTLSPGGVPDFPLVILDNGGDSSN